MARESVQSDSLQMLKDAIRQGEPARLYFFYGEEDFLLQHYLKQLYKTITSRSYFIISCKWL